jgi:hypothetical protein
LNEPRGAAETEKCPFFTSAGTKSTASAATYRDSAKLSRRTGQDSFRRAQKRRIKPEEAEHLERIEIVEGKG